MPSLRSKILKRGIKIAVKRLKGLKEIDVGERRRRIDEIANRWSKLPADCNVEKVYIGGLYAEWLTTEQNSTDEKVILYLHGGAYGYCSANTHRSLAARIMNSSGVKVLLPEYRLAPEHPFPAAIEDTIMVYQWLLDQGYDACNILFAGDSAGGGLSVASTLYLRNLGYQLPGGVICLSPWVDLTSSGDSYRRNKLKDPYLNVEGTRAAALAYAGKYPLDHELISPVFADLTGFPPLFIQVGSIEILRSDAELLAKKAHDDGVSVEMKVWKGMWHVWQASGKMLESRLAIKEIGKFVKKITSPKNRNGS
ncbi:alpha/beta hydrolase [Mesobacillus maritimus]|uniref:alpha/beta hydrolase n=1 Tax=Mesobacillus maritimus TaxID=1643336 RepID=UPI00203B5F2E|nr:alpha/beta hydrolase [Mesobacillus maritimus]MCM3669237.1 alpha/beta hydrolase [Mesobacillus maritimus]